jgi:hypothetical protein
MPQMITKIPHTYGGRKLTAGDPFTADEKFVPLLRAMGRADFAEAPPDGVYQTTDMVAAPPTRFKRRAMTSSKAVDE